MSDPNELRVIKKTNLNSQNYGKKILQRKLFNPERD